MKISHPARGITLIESDYGVQIEWNNVHNVRVTVQARYLSRTSGLCGTFNRDRGDDFLTPNGTIAGNAVDFGNSWKTDLDCEDATFVDHPCKTNPDRNATARANCSALQNSPFDACASYINPDSEGYIGDCEYDVCACDDHPTVCVCQAIEAYVDDCSSRGVRINWLNNPRYRQCSEYDYIYINKNAFIPSPVASLLCKMTEKLAVQYFYLWYINNGQYACLIKAGLFTDPIGSLALFS